MHGCRDVAGVAGVFCGVRVTAWVRPPHSQKVWLRDLPGRTAAVASSMACGDHACQETGREALARLSRFRQRELSWCLWRRGDALFELLV